MNKSELIKALAEETNIPFDDASLVVNTFIDAMKKSLIAGERIEIRGFGSFKIKEYGGYAGRNPKTGESVSVIPKRLPFFRAGKESVAAAPEVVSAVAGFAAAIRTAFARRQSRCFAERYAFPTPRDVGMIRAMPSAARLQSPGVFRHDAAGADIRSRTCFFPVR